MRLARVCAVVGGSSVARNYIRLARECPGAICKYLFTSRPNEFRDLEAEGVIVTRCLDDVLNDPSVDRVIIASRPDKHLYYAGKFVERGVDTLVEKPLFVEASVGEIERFRSLVAKSSARAFMVSQTRYQPQWKNLRAELCNSRPIMGSMLISIPRNCAYYQNGDGWRHTLASTASIQLIHWLDVLTGLFGKIESCAGYSSTFKKNIMCTDTSVASIRFESGFLISLIGTTASPCGHFELRIFTDHSIFAISDSSFKSIFTKALAKCSRLVSARFDPRFQQINEFMAASGPARSSSLMQVDQAIELSRWASILSKSQFWNCDSQ